MFTRNRRSIKETKEITVCRVGLQTWWKTRCLQVAQKLPRSRKEKKTSWRWRLLSLRTLVPKLRLSSLALLMTLATQLTSWGEPKPRWLSKTCLLLQIGKISSLKLRPAGKPFSPVIDEATDCSVTKTLGLSIRFSQLNDGVVQDTFYRLIKVTRAWLEE